MIAVRSYAQASFNIRLEVTKFPEAKLTSIIFAVLESTCDV